MKNQYMQNVDNSQVKRRNLVDNAEQNSLEIETDQTIYDNIKLYYIPCVDGYDQTDIQSLESGEFYDQTSIYLNNINTYNANESYHFKIKLIINGDKTQTCKFNDLRIEKTAAQISNIIKLSIDTILIDKNSSGLTYNKAVLNIVQFNIDGLDYAEINNIKINGYQQIDTIAQVINCEKLKFLNFKIADVDLNGRETFFYILGNQEVYFKNLNVVNCFQSDETIDTLGCIKVLNSYHITIEDGEFYQNMINQYYDPTNEQYRTDQNHYGGGMNVNTFQGVLKIKNFKFIENGLNFEQTSDTMGSGIFVKIGTKSIFQDCEFTRNSAKRGAGMYLRDVLVVEMINTQVLDNLGATYSALYFRNFASDWLDLEYSIYFRNYISQNNRGNNGGGQSIFWRQYYYTLFDGVYSLNDGSEYSFCKGGFGQNYLTHTIDIQNSRFEQNLGNEGGVFYMTRVFGVVTAQNVTVVDSLAKYGGGFISIKYTYNGIPNHKILIKDSRFNDITLQGMRGRLGSVLEIKNTEYLEMVNCTINNAPYFEYGSVYVSGATEVSIKNSKFEVWGKIYLLSVPTFKLHNSTFDQMLGQDDGGAIQLITNQIFTMTETNFTNFLVNTIEGGAIHGKDLTEIDVSDSKFQNIQGNKGGAIFIRDYDTFTMKTTNFDGITGDDQGTVGLELGKQVILEENNISNCINKGSGGGFYIYTVQEVSLIKNTFNENEAFKYGGGLYIFDCNTIFSQENTYTLNIASQNNGGGLHNEQIHLKIESINDIYSKNKASQLGGGANYNYCDGEIILNNITVEGNQALLVGGVSIQNINKITIEDFDISDNVSTNQQPNYVGGLKIKNAEDSILIKKGDLKNNVGGSIKIEDFIDFQIVDVELSKNSYGSEIFLNEGNLVILNQILIQDIENRMNNVNGGGLNLNNINILNISQMDIERVKSATGACALIQNVNQGDINNLNCLQSETKNDGTIHIKNSQNFIFKGLNCKFNNIQQEEGTGTAGVFINISKNIEFKNSQLQYNIGSTGGAIKIYNSHNIQITSTSFDNNYSQQNGGAISIENPEFYKDINYFQNDSNERLRNLNNNDKFEINIEYSIFKNNTALEKGGSIYLFKTSNPFIQNCEFLDNQSFEGGSIYQSNSQKIKVIQTNFTKIESQNIGGAMYLLNSQEIQIHDCEFQNIKSIAKGSGIYVQSNRLENLNLMDSNFINTSLEYDFDQHIFQKGEFNILSKGGGIYLELLKNLEEQNIDTQNIIMDNLNFENSQANHGAGMFIFKENSANNIKTLLGFKNIKFTNLKADAGAALRILGGFQESFIENLKQSQQFTLINNQNKLLLVDKNVNEIQTGYINNEKQEDNGMFIPCSITTYSVNGGDKTCQNCDENGICEGGYIPIYPKNDFARIEEFSAEFVECRANLCFKNDTCREGHQGLLCSQCQDLYTRGSDNYCQQCETNTTNIYLALLAKIIGLALLVGSTIKTIQTKVTQKIIKDTLMFFRYPVLINDQVTCLIKIFLLHNQVLALAYASIPKDLVFYINIFGNPMATLSTNLDCLVSIEGKDDEYKKQLLTFIITIVSLIIILVILLALTLVLLAIKKSFKTHSIPMIFSCFLCFFLYVQPSLVNNASQYVICQQIGEQSFTLMDRGLSCSQEEYQNIVLPLNLSIIFFAVLLIPILCYLKIRKYQQSGIISNYSVYRAFGIFFIEYKPSRYFWEFIIIQQKLLIILFSNLYEGQADKKVGIVTLLILFYLVLLFKNKPYQTVNINNIAIRSALIQTITLIVSLLYLNEDEEQDFIYYFAFSIILLLNAYFFILVSKEIFYEKFQGKKVQILRLLQNTSQDSKICKRLNQQLQNKNLAKKRWLLVLQTVRILVKNNKNQDNIDNKMNEIYNDITNQKYAKYQSKKSTIKEVEEENYLQSNNGVIDNNNNIVKQVNNNNINLMSGRGSQQSSCNTLIDQQGQKREQKALNKLGNTKIVKQEDIKSLNSTISIDQNALNMEEYQNTNQQLYLDSRFMSPRGNDDFLSPKKNLNK